MSTKIQSVVFALITLVVLGLILVAAHSESKINCNDPHTWSTQSGVDHCAIK